MTEFDKLILYLDDNNIEYEDHSDIIEEYEKLNLLLLNKQLPQIMPMRRVRFIRNDGAIVSCIYGAYSYGYNIDRIEMAILTETDMLQPEGYLTAHDVIRKAFASESERRNE